MLVPSNRFEVLECEAARDAVMAGELDGDRLRQGGLDVLAQHVLGSACAEPFDADRLFRRGRLGIAVPAPDARRLRQGRRFRRHRRLCAQALRSLCAAAQDARGKMARVASARGAAIPHECRRHRRGSDDRYPAAVQRPPDRRRRAFARPRSRNISSSSSSRATPSPSPATCCASRASMRMPPM